MTHILKEIAAPVIQGSIVFGITYGARRLFQAPDALQNGIVSTVAFLGRYALSKLADALEERYDWKKSTRYWVKIGFDALTLVAVTVTAIALGNLEILGLVLLASVPLIYIAVDVYRATHLKEDLPLSERIPKRVNELRSEKSPKTSEIKGLERRLARTAKFA